MTIFFARILNMSMSRSVLLLVVVVVEEVEVVVEVVLMEVVVAVLFGAGDSARKKRCGGSSETATVGALVLWREISRRRQLIHERDAWRSAVALRLQRNTRHVCQPQTKQTALQHVHVARRWNGILRQHPSPTRPTRALCVRKTDGVESIQQ